MRPGQLVSTAVAVVLSGCASTTGSPQPPTDGSAPPSIRADPFPQYPPQDAVPTGENEGQLILQDGCMALRNDGTVWVLVWPEAYVRGAVRDTAAVIDETGGVAAIAGQSVYVTGGELTDGETAATEWVLEVTNGDVPDSCLTGTYWQVTSIRASQ